GFPTKRSAKKWEAKTYSAYMEGNPQTEFPKPKEKHKKIRDAWKEYLNYKELNNLKYSTIIGYRSIYRNHFDPVFKNKDIDGLNKSCLKIIEKILRRDISTKTQTNILNLLKSFFKYLKKMNYYKGNIPNFPTIKRDLPDFRYFDSGQVTDLQRTLKKLDKNFYLMFALAVKTGLRRGELFGLRWKDIDFAKSILHVRKNFVKGRITNPKSRKSRTVPLHESTISLLKSFKHNRNYIFSKEDGSILSVSRGDKILRKACENVNLKPCGWHVLRHTFASELASSGVPIAVIKELLGHNDIATTMKYAHLSPESQRSAICQLEKYNSL
ncbi:MAG: tyrosine-type recombinase/integrase, partial [Myxococcota bacterium]